ncbi:MAG TPA: histidine kinase, partial [Chitinophagaceae bacterium]|nr:histidine kinase [Chitinophagaceae bacterium]
MTVTSSIAFRYITDSIKNENNRKEERMATLTSELQLLKSQVSPHFLFNVLNNLTYLARKQSAILEPALIKLSSLLRYMLYDTNEEKVLLDKEIK